MTVREKWTVVFNTVTTGLIKCPMGDHVGILGDLFFNVGNRHGTRSGSQAIGVGSDIGSKGNRHRTGPWVTANLEGVITVGDQSKSTGDDFTIGYRKISKTSDCTRGNCGTLTKLEVNRLCIFSGYRRCCKIRSSSLTTELIKTSHLG